MLLIALALAALAGAARDRDGEPRAQEWRAAAIRLLAAYGAENADRALDAALNEFGGLGPVQAPGVSGGRMRRCAWDPVVATAFRDFRLLVREVLARRLRVCPVIADRRALPDHLRGVGRMHRSFVDNGQDADLPRCPLRASGATLEIWRPALPEMHQLLTAKTIGWPTTRQIRPSPPRRPNPKRAPLAKPEYGSDPERLTPHNHRHPAGAKAPSMSSHAAKA